MFHIVFVCRLWAVFLQTKSLRLHSQMRAVFSDDCLRCWETECTRLLPQAIQKQHGLDDLAKVNKESVMEMVSIFTCLAKLAQSKN